ncbi:hypothetical protein DSO57_1001997 [Entomophthora muscae]|uniref:Uncharacterized protein n=1 Tax=Entomophthora muscae TaxID=34485 RepID=A0ACC2RNW2_9FUNG|nr:hypothetical protein DSO57_1001997 [Entomophthora muscae]
MNHLIFTSVLTACLGTGGYQQGPELFGPSPEGLGHDYHYDSGQLNSSILVPGLPWYLHTSPCPLWWSFGRYNIHTKVFQWLMTIYPIVTTLTGFQFSNLLPYLLQVVSTMSGYYTMAEFTYNNEPHISTQVCHSMTMWGTILNPTWVLNWLATWKLQLIKPLH